MTITESNVTKVISVTSGVYWVVVGLLLWSDYRSGDWMGKLGWAGNSKRRAMSATMRNELKHFLRLPGE